MTSHSLPTRAQWQALLNSDEAKRLLELCWAEDLREIGDITSQAIFDPQRKAKARIMTRSPTVWCGGPILEHIFRSADPDARVDVSVAEGDELAAYAIAASLEINLLAMLKAERLALNFLMRLCGIAHRTRQAVEALPVDCAARIYDTRKTLPGWRIFDKMAVCVGGGQNHRAGLFDMFLIKDNHIAAAGSISQAIQAVRDYKKDVAIEVEIDHLTQLDEALSCEPDIILLDNFKPEELREAVKRVAGRVALEASGGIRLEHIAEVAATGVDRISMGELTHTVIPADLTLEVTS